MNVLDTIIEDIEEKRINSSTRESIESVYDLSKLISNWHSVMFFPPIVSRWRGSVFRHV